MKSKPTQKQVLDNIVFLLLLCAILVPVCGGTLFVGYHITRPMQDERAPQGMTIVDLVLDRVDAARDERARACGESMVLTMAAYGPVYSLVYTAAAVSPGGFFGRAVGDDPEIVPGVAGAPWVRLPGIWWRTVERLTWSLAGETPRRNCPMRPVAWNPPPVQDRAINSRDQLAWLAGKSASLRWNLLGWLLNGLRLVADSFF